MYIVAKIWRELISSLKTLPFGVRIFTGMFALIPVLSSIVFSTLPNHSISDLKSVFVWLDLFTLWIGPSLIVLGVLFRNRRTLVFYLLESLAILYFSFHYLEGKGLFSDFLRILALFSLTIGGVLIVSKDFLLPLIAEQRRLWRKNKRMPVERLVIAKVGESESPVPALLKNVSLTGFCLSGYRNDGLLANHKELVGKTFEVRLVLENKEFILNTKLVWYREFSSDFIAGFAVADYAVMSSLKESSASAEAANGFLDAAVRYLSRTEVKRTASLLWACSLSFMLAQPGCGKLETQTQLDSVNAAGVLTELSTFSVEAAGAGGGSFALASIDPGPLVTVSGCTSGYNSLSVSSNSVRLYVGDKGCVAKLDQFSFNENTYVVAPWETFAPHVGGTTTFVSGTGKRIVVTVTEQLNSPLQSSSSFKYSFYALDDGGNVSLPINRHIVYVEALTSQVAEGVDSAARVRFRRIAQSSTAAYVIKYAVSGSAVAGVDYTPLTGSVTMPSNTSEVELDIPLINDAAAEPTKLITVTVAYDPNYDRYGAANIILSDSDTATGALSLVGHYQPTGFLATGSNIGSWSDSTTYARHATQTTTTNQPQLVANAYGQYSAAGFDGVKQFLRPPSNADFDSGGPYTEKVISMVFTTGADVKRRQVLWEQGSNTRGLNMYLDQGRLYFSVWNNVADEGTGSAWTPKYCHTKVSPGLTYIASLKFDQTTGRIRGYVFGNLACEKTGVRKLYAHSNGIGLGAVNGTTLFHDMSTNISGTFYSGRIFETLVHNGATADAAVVSVHQSLQQKYGLLRPIVSLDVTGAYAVEGIGSSPYFKLSLDSPQATDIEVDLAVSGSAMAGSDYQTLPSQVTIPAYSTELLIPLITVNDSQAEMPELVKLSIIPAEEYAVALNDAVITLSDNEVFTPLGSNVLWLDAARNVTMASGSRVSQWGDLSASNQSVTQSTKNSQPLVTTIGGRSAVTFDGVRQRLIAADNIDLNTAPFFNGKSVVIAFRTGADVSRTQVLWEQGSNSLGLNFYINSGRVYLNAWNTTNNDLSATTPWAPKAVSTPVVANKSYVAIFEIDAESGIARGTVNGVSLGQISGVGRLYSHTSASLGFSNSRSLTAAGVEIASGQFFGGSIFEMMMFNHELDPNLRAQIQGYAGQKYLP